jgi:predicted nucleic-acid-binding protein
MIFVDTNYFLRYLLEDNLHQQKKAKELFMDGAKGKKKLFTSDIVIFEIYWVLSSFYGKNKNQIAEILKGILSFGFLKVEGKDILQDALLIYREKNLDFEDSYNLVYAKDKEASEFRTFDKKLAKLF